MRVVDPKINPARYYKRVTVQGTAISCGRSRRAGGRRVETRGILAAFLAAATLAPALAGAQRRETGPPPVFPLGELWRARLEGAPGGPPLVAAGTVFVAIAGGHVDAYALADGAPLWSIDLELAADLAAGDGLIFARTPTGVVAIDSGTGRVQWRVEIGPGTAAPRWRSGWLLATTSDGTLVALRAADGREIWRRALGSPAAAAASVEGDRAYVPLADGRVVALAIERGEVVWDAGLGGAGREILALADRLYVGSEDNSLYCLSTKDGRRLWQWRTGGDVLAGAVVDASRLYFMSLDNVLRAVDRRSGVQRWRLPLPTRPAGRPALAGVTVMAPVSSRVLMFAHRERGRPVARVELPADLLSVSGFDADAAASLVAAVVDSSGQANLVAYGTVGVPPSVPLVEPPGLDLGPPVPLLRKELPVRLLARPGLSRTGG